MGGWRPVPPPATPAGRTRAPRRTAIRTSRLLSYRWRSLRRRLLGATVLGRLVAVLVAAGVIAALWAGASSFAADDVRAATAATAALDDLVRERVFWLTTLMVLVFAYTTFETFFRARDLRFIATLPIRGRTRYLDLLTRAYLVHLPLLLPVAAYATAIAAAGATSHAAYATALAGLVYAVGIPLCTWLHLLAGRSLLSEGSALRKQLAGNVFDSDAALLVYAPAAGLLATLLLAIPLDFALRDAVLRGAPGRLAPVLGLAAAIAAFAIFKGRALADASLHVIVPRFLEVDVPPPFRDDGVRKRIPGEGLARFLPAAARPHYLRDLRQLRRRFRLDRVLLWVYAAALVRLDVLTGDHAPASLAANLTALGLIVGVFLASAFRLHGRELASPWLDRALPAAPRDARLGRLAADALYPLQALALTVAAVLASGRPLTALPTLGAGLALTAVLLLASQALAARAFPTWVSAAATLFRGAVVGLAGVVLWLKL